jgi:D-3-phosphoglycerate dehydrogenase / 2-oxoglutarate reductase
MKVLVSNIMMLAEKERFARVLESKGIKPIFPDVDQFLSEEQLLNLDYDFDGWLAGDDQITRKVLNKFLPRLKVISKWGTGLDSIDLDSAIDLGVPVYNSPGAFRDAVAEVGIGYALNLSRDIVITDKSVRSGLWPKHSSEGLVGKKLGVIGYGAIGRGVAERAIGMKMKVSYYDLFPVQVEGHLKSTVKEDLEVLLSTSDFICLACNLTSDNRHLINKDTINTMKDGVFLINISRGPLVNLKDLIQALNSGKVAGAGLDVFEEEPLSSSDLKTMDNVILGSHNANNLRSATEFVHTNTINNLMKGLGFK